MLPQTTSTRIAELEQHATDTGVELPMDALVICRAEDAGFAVDLTNGQLLYSTHTTFAATALGRLFSLMASEPHNVSDREG